MTEEMSMPENKYPVGMVVEDTTKRGITSHWFIFKVKGNISYGYLCDEKGKVIHTDQTKTFVSE